MITEHDYGWCRLKKIFIKKGQRTNLLTEFKEGIPVSQFFS